MLLKDYVIKFDIDIGGWEINWFDTRAARVPLPKIFKIPMKSIISVVEVLTTQTIFTSTSYAHHVP